LAHQAKLRTVSGANSRRPLNKLSPVQRGFVDAEQQTLLTMPH